MSSASLPYRLNPEPVALLDLGKTLAGPATAARWRRTALIYTALLLLGTALAWLARPEWAAFGLGLTMPGGGFLLHAASPLASTTLHVLLFLATLLLFVFALFLWIATGNIAAPVLVWLGSALVAATMDHWGGVPYLSLAEMCRNGSLTTQLHDARLWLPLGIAAFSLIATWRFRRRLPALRAEAARINTFLADARTPITRNVDVTTGAATVSPVTVRDLQQWRFLLDRALQPVSEFNGFDRIDEFREAAKRYQICNLSYMLSMHAYARTPSFRGYQLQAQENLALKMMDHRCWSYWRLENIWGHFKTDPNPFIKDNIMYYGWYAAMLGLHQLNFGDERFSRPGGIRLEHPNGTVYETSFPDLCQLILKNMQGSDFCLFPCEPRWIYPICNNFGALALRCHDRLYGTALWDSVKDRYRKGLEEEFITLVGRITAIRDYHTGLTLPALTATMADAITAMFIHPVLPDVAARSWAILRHDLIRIVDGEVLLKLNGWDKIDFGNYRPSLITTYGLIAVAAREMGDDEVADGLLARLDREFPSQTIGGVRHYPKASTSAHAVIHAARVLRANTLYDLVNVGMPEAWKTGPVLAHAEYPQVLVAGAVSDGKDLKLHLASDGGEGLHTIGLAQLKPAARYRITDSNQEAFVADAEGCASLRVALGSDVRSFHIVPLN